MTSYPCSIPAVPLRPRSVRISNGCGINSSWAKVGSACRIYVDFVGLMCSQNWRKMLSIIIQLKMKFFPFLVSNSPTSWRCSAGEASFSPGKSFKKGWLGQRSRGWNDLLRGLILG